MVTKLIWRVFLLVDFVFVVYGHYRRSCVDSIYGMWLRTCGLRSSVQNCSAATVAFYMEYFHAKGQYCEASMVLVCRWNKNHGMMDDSEFLGIYSSWRHWHERVPICIWWIWVGWSYPLACKSFDVVAHASCVCISSKVKIFCFLSVTLGVHMLDCGIKWLLSFNYKSVISLRDAVTGPILSLTTNHVCSSCIPWILGT